MMRKSWFSYWFILLVVLAGCAGETFDTTFIHHPEDLINEGEAVYLENCARCHQLDGEGFPRIYPRLTTNPLITLHDPTPVIQTVLYGQGSMPGFKNSLTHEETAAVISYIRNAWGNDAPVVFPKQTR